MAIYQLNVLKGPASEALRPYTPKKMKVTKIEKTKLWNRFSFGTKWNIRDISRHKARSAMTTIGVLGNTILVIAALGMKDTMNKFVDVFYNQAINYETRLNISENTYNEKAIEIANEYIINTQSKSIVIKSFDSFMELMNISVTLLIVAAVVLGVVVLYNLGVMSFMERYREMSTLKVLGFKDKKIGNLLITQNMWISLLWTIIGIPLGVWALDYLIKALASEYEMSLSISWLSFVISILITLGISWFVSIVIANKNKKIDMVESLKCSE